MDLNRYSDPEDRDRLLALLADYAGVPQKHIIPSPGSDLLLREIIHTYSQGRKIVIVSPSFFPTVQAAKQLATKIISIRLSPPNFDLDPDLLLDQLNEPCLLILDNPNNPRGKVLLDRKMVASIAGLRDILFGVDEAYYFLLLKTNIPDMVDRLPDKGILISDLSNQLPAGYIRVSVGNRRDNDAFITGFTKIHDRYRPEGFTL